MSLVTLDPRSGALRQRNALLPTHARRSQLEGLPPEVVARCCECLTAGELSAWCAVLLGNKDLCRLGAMIYWKALGNSGSYINVRQIFYNTCVGPGGCDVGLPLGGQVRRVLALTGGLLTTTAVVPLWGDEETDLFLEALRAQASTSCSFILTRGLLDSVLPAAATAGNIRVVQAILQRDRVTRDVIGRALTGAVENGHSAIVAILLATKVAGGVTREAINWVFGAAAASGHSAIVDTLLATKVAGGVAQFEIGLALRAAAENGHKDIVDALLATTIAGGVTQAAIGEALAAAARCGHKDIVDVLLATTIAGGVTQGAIGWALINAAANGHRAIVDALLATTIAGGVTQGAIGVALERAARCGHKAIVDALLATTIAGGVTLDEIGWALGAAAENGHIDIVYAISRNAPSFKIRAKAALVLSRLALKQTAVSAWGTACLAGRVAYRHPLWALAGGAALAAVAMQHFRGEEDPALGVN